MWGVCRDAEGQGAQEAYTGCISPIHCPQLPPCLHCFFSLLAQVLRASYCVIREHPVNYCIWPGALLAVFMIKGWII